MVVIKIFAEEVEGFVMEVQAVLVAKIFVEEAVGEEVEKVFM